jgi:hypothetical protein
MNDNAFDEALRRVAADEKLPYADEAWTRISARLDAHDSGKKRGLVIPLPVIRWAAAAAVVVLALAAGWWLRDAGMGERIGGEGLAADSRNASGAQTLPATKTPETLETPGTSSTRQEKNTADADGVAIETHRSRKNFQPEAPRFPQQSFEPARQEVIAQTFTTSPADTLVPKNKAVDNRPVTPGPFKPSRSEETRYIIDGLVTPGDERRPGSRDASFHLAGGYGYGSNVPAFSVGVAVRKPMSGRLQLEGALALVGTTPDPIGSTSKMEKSMQDGLTSSGASNFGGEPTQQPMAAQQAAAAEAEYQDLRARQLFVQAAPVLMYRLVGGLSAGGGVDAQRRVSANSSTRETYLNAVSSNALPALPEWDFGLALRTDYNVTKHVRLGVQYRESIRATSANGTKTEGRNYWLLQAGFRLR